MNRVRSRSTGYTITETMIFLAVSGGLFLMAMLLVNGQQGRTEFTQGARDMESRVRDVLDDVSTGYYPANPNYTCERDLNNDEGPDFADNPGVRGQGANSECIFIGRVIQFRVASTNDEEYNVISVAGIRLALVGDTEVTTIKEARPRALVPTPGDSNNPPDLTENSKYPGGMRVGKVTYQNGGLPVVVSSMGVFTTFGIPDINGLKSGSLNVNILALGSAPETRIAFSNDVINNLHEATSNPVTNPSGGMQVCFVSTGSNQIAIMTIGGSGRQSAVDMEIKSGTRLCP